MTHANKTEMIRVWSLFAPVFVLTLGADQASKWWAENTLSLGKSVDFGFALGHNYGITFGMQLPIWLIFVLSVGILVTGAYMVYEEKLWRDRWHLIGLALMLSGALGNLIDRVRLGYVVDFIKVYWWPTFNLADVYIVLAAAYFLVMFSIKESQA